MLCHGTPCEVYCNLLKLSVAAYRVHILFLYEEKRCSSMATASIVPALGCSGNVGTASWNCLGGSDMSCCALPGKITTPLQTNYHIEASVDLALIGGHSGVVECSMPGA